MVRLSITSGAELDAFERWFGRLRESRPAHVVATGYAICVHCSLVLAAVGASKVAVVALLVSIPINLAAAVAFLVTVAVYTHNKLTDLAEDGVNDPDRAAFFGPRKRLFGWLAVGAYVGALAVAAFGGPTAFTLTLFPGLLGVLYSSRWLPVGDVDRLKDVVVVGTTAVALAWAVPLALLPLAFEGGGFGVAAAVVLVFFFLRTVVAVELFNVRDVAGDRREGVGTLPVVLGVRPTRYVLGGLNACSIALLVAAVLAGVLAPIALAAVAGVVYSLVLVALLGRRSTDHLCLASYLESPLMVVAFAAAIAFGG
jgi:4-hydroxybenzoate polyprenyltransferase